MKAAELCAGLKTCELCGKEWKPSKPKSRTCSPRCRAILRERETPSPGKPREYPSGIVSLAVSLYRSGKTVAEVQAELPQGFKAQRILERFTESRRKAAKRNQGGLQNHMWRGDDAGNTAIHLRLRAERGPAASHKCHDCNSLAAEWSYQGGSITERSSARGPYTSDLSYYVPRCISCHRNYDSKQRGDFDAENR